MPSFSRSTCAHEGLRGETSVCWHIPQGDSSQRTTQSTWRHVIRRRCVCFSPSGSFICVCHLEVRTFSQNETKPLFEKLLSPERTISSPSPCWTLSFISAVEKFIKRTRELLCDRLLSHEAPLLFSKSLLWMLLFVSAVVKATNRNRNPNPAELRSHRVPFHFCLSLLNAFLHFSVDAFAAPVIF